MDPSTLSFDARGLIPVVTQDATTGQVLMLAYANSEAVTQTLETREAHYYSRSRNELWHKGATSGHIQKIVEVRFDCDEDALLYRVSQTGAACHTGEYSCFYRPLSEPAPPGIGEMMGVLERVVEDRLDRLPEGSYVAKLHERGLGYVAQKVVEEAGREYCGGFGGKTGRTRGRSRRLALSPDGAITRERRGVAGGGSEAFRAASREAVVGGAWV